MVPVSALCFYGTRRTHGIKMGMGSQPVMSAVFFTTKWMLDADSAGLILGEGLYPAVGVEGLIPRLYFKKSFDSCTPKVTGGGNYYNFFFRFSSYFTSLVL
jgi:hypothetical protein